MIRFCFILFFALVSLNISAETNQTTNETADSLLQKKVITYGDIDYVPSRSFHNNSVVEEIVFEGLVGHIDGYQIENCPKLKRVIFRGPVNTTGGPQFAKDCPLLEEIRFEGLVIWSAFNAPLNCPNFKGYTITGAVHESRDTVCFPQTQESEIVKRADMKDDLKQLVAWQLRMFENAPHPFLRKLSFETTPNTIALLEAVGDTTLIRQINDASEKIKKHDDLRSKLDILKDSPEYKADDKEFSFAYAQPSDSLLSLSREHFKLDSVAGNGDDISRIKNLLYWVHDIVRHDGSSDWPNCGFNLRELVKVCRDEGRGVNCRFMAMMLTEALLAVGIPARYITCESKAWDSDSDCHVICVAWSRSLDKWVWVDPTFAAFVTDENGVMLHPGEVRYRLQHDLPLVLNEDANWNNESKQTKKQYLETYMAKNLYIMSCNSINQSEPEGRSTHKQGDGIALVPQNSNYSNARIITTDEVRFWQKPRGGNDYKTNSDGL